MGNGNSDMMVRIFFYICNCKLFLYAFHEKFIVCVFGFLFHFKPDLDTITNARLLLEKHFHLTSSNSKYIVVGIKPATKMYNKECTGFYVEVGVGGKSMKNMSLGGIDGFMNLCQTLRQFDELKYTYPMSAANYDDIETQFPLNISKKPWNGSICFNIETIVGDHAIIAQNSCTELLRIENFIIIAIKFMNSIVNDIETKFNALVQKGATDYSAALSEIAKSKDTFGVDVLCNFNELFKVCIDQVSRLNKPTTSAATATAPKRGALSRSNTATASTPTKRKATTKKVKQTAPKKQKVDSCSIPDEHNYTVGEAEHEEVDEVELIECEGEEEETPNREPLGLIESGQRFESEHYL